MHKTINKIKKVINLHARKEKVKKKKYIYIYIYILEHEFSNFNARIKPYNQNESHLYARSEKVKKLLGHELSNLVE